jgi:hypothetical protein
MEQHGPGSEGSRTNGRGSNGRGRARRSFWTMALTPVEAGDILSPDRLSRLYELLPENGMTIHPCGAMGDVILIASIPEEQLSPFKELEWVLPQRIEEGDEFVLSLVAGKEDPIDCPFVFDLTVEQELQEAMRLVEQEELEFFGVTHMEEGLMLTVKGLLGLPAELRQEIAESIEGWIQSQGST